MPGSSLQDQSPTRPEVRMIAVSTLDGKATVSGSSRVLGNEEDSRLLQATRQWADALVVGAATIRAENYGPINDPHLQVIVVSKTLDFGTSTLGNSARPPLAVTTTDCNEATIVTATKQGFRVLPVGDLSAGTLIDIAVELGCRRIAVEGGPRIYAMFLQEKLVDQILLTFDPRLAGTAETPLWLDIPALDLELESLRQSPDGTVFLSYKVGGVKENN